MTLLDSDSVVPSVFSYVVGSVLSVCVCVCVCVCVFVCVYARVCVSAHERNRKFLRSDREARIYVNVQLNVVLMIWHNIMIVV